MNKDDNNNDLDLIELALTIWKNRKLIFISTTICTFIGLATAIITPNEYTSTVVLYPQSNDAKTALPSGLSGVAAMAGISLNQIGSTSTIPPSLYPEIIKGFPFLDRLMNSYISVDGLENDITVCDYFNNYNQQGVLHTLKKYTIGIPGLVLSLIRKSPKPKHKLQKSNITKLTNKQEVAISNLKSRVHIEINEVDGYITINSTMPEAKMSAQITDAAKKILQEIITKLKIKKASDQLDFINKRYNEKKQQFEKIQLKLARFRDRNRNLTTAIALYKSKEIETEYNLAYSVYNELAKRVETQQIKVKGDTPIFTVIRPVIVPNKKSAPNRPLIILVWLFIGLVIGISIIYIKQFIRNFKYERN